MTNFVLKLYPLINLEAVHVSTPNLDKALGVQGQMCNAERFKIVLDKFSRLPSYMPSDDPNQNTIILQRWANVHSKYLSELENLHKLFVELDTNGGVYKYLFAAHSNIPGLVHSMEFSSQSFELSQIMLCGLLLRAIYDSKCDVDLIRAEYSVGEHAMVHTNLLEVLMIMLQIDNDSIAKRSAKFAIAPTSAQFSVTGATRVLYGNVLKKLNDAEDSHEFENPLSPESVLFDVRNYGHMLFTVIGVRKNHELRDYKLLQDMWLDLRVVMIAPGHEGNPVNRPVIEHIRSMLDTLTVFGRPLLSFEYTMSTYPVHKLVAGSEISQNILRGFEYERPVRLKVIQVGETKDGGAFTKVHIHQRFNNLQVASALLRSFDDVEQSKQLVRMPNLGRGVEGTPVELAKQLIALTAESKEAEPLRATESSSRLIFVLNPLQGGEIDETEHWMSALIAYSRWGVRMESELYNAAVGKLRDGEQTMVRSNLLSLADECSVYTLNFQKKVDERRLAFFMIVATTELSNIPVFLRRCTVFAVENGILSMRPASVLEIASWLSTM